MESRNSLLISYLEAVVADDPAHPEDKAAGVPHSDRHLAFLAYLRAQQGRTAIGDQQLLREAAVVEAERVGALHNITDQFACTRIDSLILKGAAFSYTVYPAPYLRARNDDDVWVRHADFAGACAVLERCGYRPHVEMTAPDITRQRHFEGARGSLAHQVDLHWWPVNPSAFDLLPPFDECLAMSRPLAAVGRHARAPGPVHALLLACAHRGAHHTPTEDAMWLCDLHLLASALDAAQWAQFEARARTARLAQICGVELTRAREALATPVPHGVLEQLLSVRGEPSAHYLRPLGPLRDLWLELAARDSAAARMRLLTQHLFPPRQYIAARYGFTHVGLLPLFYIHRAVHGLARWTAHLVARLGR